MKQIQTVQDHLDEQIKQLHQQKRQAEMYEDLLTFKKQRPDVFVLIDKCLDNVPLNIKEQEIMSQNFSKQEWSLMRIYGDEEKHRRKCSIYLDHEPLEWFFVHERWVKSDYYLLLIQLHNHNE